MTDLKALAPDELGLAGSSGRALYNGSMQLRTARLCLDCEELHDLQHCPVCASEAFTYVSRWVPAPERRSTQRPAITPPQADAYRRLSTDNSRTGWNRLLGRGALGLVVAGVAGWLARGVADGSRSENEKAA